VFLWFLRLALFDQYPNSCRTSVPLLPGGNT
jgi:hypothetical protein